MRHKKCGTFKFRLVGGGSSQSSKMYYDLKCQSCDIKLGKFYPNDPKEFINNKDSWINKGGLK